MRDKIIPRPVEEEIETAVLASMINWPEMAELIIRKINKNSFYNLRYQIIFETIKNMIDRGLKTNILLIIDYAKKNKTIHQIGGVQGINEIARQDQMLNTDILEKYCLILIEKQKARDLLELIQKIETEVSSNTDIFDILQSAEDTLFAIASIDKHNHQSYQQIIISDAKMTIEHAIKMRHENKIIGVKSGFSEIDNNLFGWSPGEVTVIAGRPGMGKSAFASCVARNADCNVGIFTQEMKERMFFFRMACNDLSISFGKFKSGDINEEEKSRIFHAFDQYENSMFLLNRPGIHVSDLRRHAKFWHKENNVKLLIIDYLQLINGHGEIREQEIAFVSKNIKELAEELDIPVILLAQLSRATEASADKVPKLSHLRESGAIEQDADNIGFIWRPGYYMKEDQLLKSNYTNDYTELIFAKCRNGDPFTAELSFQGIFQRFTDYNKNLPQFIPKSPDEFIQSNLQDHEEIEF